MVDNRRNESLSLLNRFKTYFQHIILQPEITPEKTALSFSIGLAIAVSPFIGLHTCITILVCLIFNNLHRPLMLLACYLNNPWTMLPVASISVLVGNLLMGRGIQLNLGNINWHTIGWRSFVTKEGLKHMHLTLKPVLLPYLLGGFALSILALFLGYYVMLRIARHLRRLSIVSNSTSSQ
jgi:hypothetical protein